MAQREKINKEISDWVNDLPKLNQNDTAGIDSELSLAEKNLGDIRQYLSACFATINASVNLTPAQISAYQNSLGASGVSGARSEIDSASAAITNQKQALDNSKSLIAQSQNALALTQAGARTEDIAAQTARVAQAQAAVYAAQAAAAKNTLRSPIDGQIAKISGSVGEFASPGIPVATVINSRQYEIEIRLSETDVAQVSLGDEAQVTLDAYPGQAYSAKVVAIDGAPSIDENHSTGYKVKLNLTENNSAIKTDMTANVNISVARKSSALILPQTAVIRVNDQYFVMRPGNIRQEVKIGLWGSDGQAEVISGLNEGDSVIILGQ